MARFAMVEDASGIVVNVVEWDGNETTWRPPANYTMIADIENQAGVGFKWDGIKFTPPPSGGDPGPIVSH